MLLSSSSMFTLYIFFTQLMLLDLDFQIFCSERRISLEYDIVLGILSIYQAFEDKNYDDNSTKYKKNEINFKSLK